jgi:hypothetical protein
MNPLEQPSMPKSQILPKQTRCFKFTTDKSDVANSYKNNNSKEELVLEHVLEYAR